MEALKKDSIINSDLIDRFSIHIIRYGLDVMEIVVEEGLFELIIVSTTPIAETCLKKELILFQ